MTNKLLQKNCQENMVPKLFIDSNVVIDSFTDRQPHANAASELFELNENGKIQLYLSAVSIHNIYCIVRRYLGHEKTLEVVEDLTDMTEIIGTTKNKIVQALKNNFKDFEVSIQLFKNERLMKFTNLAIFQAN